MITNEKMAKDGQPEVAIEMVGKMRYAKDRLPWGEVVGKFMPNRNGNIITMKTMDMW